ncbi:UNVERIFIED_ORG: TRAP-type C4-dicarboxylate transport system permease small subunit [Martelella mediterranea]
MNMRKRGSAPRRVADLAINAIAVLMVIVFAVMMFLVFLQVVDRFAPGPSFFWTEEVVRILLVWSVMLGLPVVLYYREEIIVDVISLSADMEFWRGRLASALGIVFLLVLAWQGYLFTARSAAFSSPTLGLSRAWMYAPIPIGAALGVIALLIRPGHSFLPVRVSGDEGDET